MRFIPAILTFFLGASACSAVPVPSTLDSELKSLQALDENAPGFAVYVISGDGKESAATGAADPDTTPMSALIPVRIASVTKTFVAAAILRLWEDGRLDLDAAIDALIAPKINALLSGDAYDTKRITVRHLLMHASGMPEHVTESYIEQVLANPSKIWTPAEQIRFLIESTQPLAAPGDRYHYSDSGYVLLGEVLREVTGLPIHIALDNLLKLDQIGLSSVYWDEAELPSADAPARAHQWAFGQDTYAIHGSMDAHGGGGLVASVKDMAVFYDALFSGLVFEKPSTLTLMKTAPGHPNESLYRIGLFQSGISGLETFQHSGFWGTLVIHVPALGLTVSGVSLRQDKFGELKQLMNQLIAARAQAQSAQSR